MSCTFLIVVVIFLMSYIVSGVRELFNHQLVQVSLADYMTEPPNGSKLEITRCKENPSVLGLLLITSVGCSTDVEGTDAVTHANGGVLEQHTDLTKKTASKKETTAETLFEGDVDDYEPVEGFSYSKTRGNSYEIRFSALDRHFELIVSPNVKLFGKNSRVIRNNVEMSHADAGLSIPYMGVVKGDPDSWVRVSKVGNHFEGVFFAFDELLDLVPDKIFPDQ